jgi:DNA polymerase delta subunit 3
LESDDEDEEEGVEEPKVERDLAKEEAIRKKKKEDEDALKAMMDMDDDDVEMEDTPAEAPRSPDWEEAAEVEEEVEEEESKPLDVQKEEEAKEEEPKEIATETSGGRRRGRRKVKKARTVRDEKGYLETKFEEVWESFSEDEPEPVKKKEAFKKAPVKKAPAGKKGQGSIMSFFGKK